MSRYALRVTVVAYVGLLVGWPVVYLFDRALAPGWSAFCAAWRDPAMTHAALLTLEAAAFAVPLNALFGVGVALWVVRGATARARLVDRLVDVPLAVSPVIVGLIVELAYGQGGWFGAGLAKLGWRVMFAFPGIVLVSVIVSIPLVARQVVPALRQAGVAAEQTAATLGASPWRVFRTITLATIAWPLVYGVSLTFARVVGEYGAVLIVSGNVAQVTQTLTLAIGGAFDQFTPYQGFAGAAVLAAASLVVLGLIGLARARERRSREHRVA